MHSSRFFQVKPIGRLFYEVQKKLGNHTISYQSLLLSTTVLNDYLKEQKFQGGKFLQFNFTYVVFHFRILRVMWCYHVAF